MRWDAWELAIKKTLNHPKANADAQRIFQNKITSYTQQGKAIVYIDESGFADDMPRTHGYSKKGTPCYGVHDWGAKGRTNVIGALLGKKLLTVSLFECNINSNIFHAWVEQDLLPKLPNGAVLVMDNATFHKRQDTQNLIRDNGFILEYLPPYSPQLNPIEQSWAYLKSIRKNINPRLNVYSKRIILY